MKITDAVIFGLTQGITEFLPISSSGHLVVIGRFIKIPASTSFIIFLHGGTLLAILFYFSKDIRRIFLSLFFYRDKSLHNSRRLFAFIILGTLPVALVGGIWGERIEVIFQNIFFVSFAFFCTGLFLFLSENFPRRKIKYLQYHRAFLIGVAQSFALLPGISRSGVTISMALFLGIKRKESFRFSFLLAVPAILGALVKTGSVREFLIGPEEIIAFLSSFVFGILSLSLLKKIVSIRRLSYFSFYLWCMSIFTLFLALR
ncbi:undecaprenyl-diphosphate phosphatase [Candidatus Calescamantes bacterium]|nr:undecaprenyl-diphosphate phosphatase [Candidatus Calescamantes bacterium]